MSRHIFFCCTLVIALVGIFNQNVFGWGGPSHSAMCKKVFDDPVVAPLISGFNQSTVENWTGEPGDWQDGQWDNINARAYIDTGVSPNGLNWQSLDETTRVKYMMHNAGDVAVPIGHSPACYNPGGYSNTIIEGILEAQVSLWSTYPNITGTCNFTNTKTGHTYNYTGTYSQILSTHYNACRDNMTWYKSTEHWPGYHTTGENQDAGWNGTKLAQMMMRATFVDYMLDNQKAATIGDVHYLSGTNSYDFDAASSYDKDNIIWQSNGTYTQAGGGITQYKWDFNYDGTWDYFSTSGHAIRTASQLIAMGLTPNSKVYYPFGVKDDEGKWHESVAWFNFYPSGVPEPASLSLLAVGALAILRRRSGQVIRRKR